MQPEDAMRELTEARSTVAGRGPMDGSVNETYALLRRWAAIVALALPVLLVVSSWPALQPSISHYYFCPGDWRRDALVGILAALGFFLYFYKGYTRREDWSLNLAAIAALLVAFAPMPSAVDMCTGGVEADLDVPLIPSVVHFPAAAILFFTMGYVCIACAGATLGELKDPIREQRYRASYHALGTLMIAVPGSLLLLYLMLPRLTRGSLMFWIEAAGIALFAVFWLLKSREIAEIMQAKR